MISRIQPCQISAHSFESSTFPDPFSPPPPPLSALKIPFLQLLSISIDALYTACMMFWRMGVSGFRKAASRALRQDHLGRDQPHKRERGDAIRVAAASMDRQRASAGVLRCDCAQEGCFADVCRVDGLSRLAGGDLLECFVWMSR